jgi:transcriptional regulator with XRE-family HTH domain
VIQRIRKGPEERAQFVASHVDKGIAYQIRALRDRQGLSQEKLAAMVQMNQNAISRLESPTRGRPTITTLKRLAEAFGVALVVRFEPFSNLAKWASGTPSLTQGLSAESLAVPNFQEEEEAGIFDAVLSATSATALPTINVTAMSVAGTLHSEQVVWQASNTMAETRVSIISEVPAIPRGFVSFSANTPPQLLPERTLDARN